MKEKWAETLEKRLSGHTMEPPEGLWEDIASDIDQSKKPRKKIAMVITSAMTAAAMVVGALLLLNKEEAITPQEIIAINDSINRDTQQIAESHSVIENNNKIAQLVNNQPYIAQEEIPVIEKTAENTDIETSETLKDEPGQKEEAPKEKKETTTMRYKDQPTRLNDMRTKPKKESRLTMGLAFTGGIIDNGTDRFKSYRNYMYSDYSPGLDYADAGTLGKTNIINQTANHHLPMRVGLNIGYQINRRWAVESGLSYTYLYSDLSEEEENVIRFYKQRLHYLGIPVTAKYNFLCGNTLNVYATGGAMIEKSVKGTVNTMTELNGEKTFNSNENIKAKPLQFSVNAAVGAEYQFIKGVSAYLEPSLGYYFKDNTSLQHYYKDHPLSPSIKVGVRINVNGR